jgi:zinc metalloprotease ZmpB
MPFSLNPNVHVERAPDGSVLQLRHLQQPYVATATGPRSLADQYLRDVAGIYAIPGGALAGLSSHFEESNEFTAEALQLHFYAENSFLGTSTIAYVQTIGGLPIWEAGLSVAVQPDPRRVTSSYSTFHHNAKVLKPAREFRPITPAELKKQLRLNTREQRFEITSERRLIYRYERALREDPEAAGEPAPLHGPKPKLPLAAIGDNIAEGQHYIVTEVLFTTNPGPRSLNWRVFIEERTGAVLYLRALLACVLGNVFIIDPVSDTGNSALTGCSGDATLDPIQSTITLNVTPATGGSAQSLTGPFVTLSDFRSPTSVPPLSPPVSFTAASSDGTTFGAVNAFHHMDRFFRLMSDLGFDPTTFFSATTLPLPVDYLDTTNGDPQAWTYGNSGNVGCQGIGFAHTNITCGTAVLMGADQRVAFHECSHLILLEKIHSANFGFCHSTGDSLAVIFADPQSNAPDRFLTFPFVPLIDRRHDRSVAAGWAWGGSEDDKGYGSEQVLSTTQFRLYLSAGGADDRGAVRSYASNYILYVIIRAVGSLGPGTITPTPSADVWATALMNADTGTTSFQGIPGGTVHKMIRWSFEKQGLYQPAGAPPPPGVVTVGTPPDVDVYIDDGRGGEYPYLEGFWNNTDIWNRNAVDGGTSHETPIVGVANYAYVRVKNRGTQSANNVSVSGYHTSPATGLNWPDDWTPMTTPTVSAGSIPSGGFTVVGPFTWTPEFIGHECMLMIATADGDLPNTDPATGLACATGPTPHWRLVPFDNNLGQRNVAPVAGGGGLSGLTASLRGRTFTARNPFERPARVTLEAVLPRFLIQRGWSVQFQSAGGAAFTLFARGDRQIVFSLLPGADFSASEVEKDALIQIQTRIDGQLVGGMSYLIDPGLKSPPNEHPGPKHPTPGDEHHHCGGHKSHIHCHGGRTRIIIEIDRDE